MNKRRRLIRHIRHVGLIGALTAATAVATVSAAIAQDSFVLPDFSATEVTHVKGRQIAYTIYHSGSNFRVDLSPELAVLYMPARDTVYRLMFKSTQCIEYKGVRPRPVSGPLQLLSEGKVKKRTPIGTEVAEGHTCKVESVLVTATNGTQYRFKVWEATDLNGIPVRVDLQSGASVATTTYRDIKPQTPDPALFKPPANCKPFEKTYQIAPPEKHGSGS
jgi:hypothetical protein